MTASQTWRMLPVPLTAEMEVAFTEAWYAKRRCIDDVDMADAWQAACEAAPSPPLDPHTESLSRQVGRLNSMLLTAGSNREKLQLANGELLTLLRESLKIDEHGFYNVTMCPNYRQRVREVLQKHEPRRPNQPSVVDDDIDHLQKALEAERPGSEDIRCILHDTIARAEAERDAALAELKALQDQRVPVKLVVVHRGHEVDEPQLRFSDDFAREFDGLPAGTEVSLYTRPSPSRFRGEGLADLRFPTMLRQMWSGGDVQAWLDDQMPMYAWPGLQRASFQSRVGPWLIECFGQDIANDKQERNHRFLEEALELVQACGATESEAHQLVDYVFAREVGEQPQEVGGVMVTLAALCYAHELRMHQAGETELDRISNPEVMSRIRDKQSRKPAFGPLPGVYPDREPIDSGAPTLHSTHK
ncbi:hypothetical protein H8F21_14010 [Pseudomonas sp. P66]|uniref:Uncharacterized protein n=1 Tax=Pseudomonas arcuscaelestis TaxID=2710591 RepID=A0ABS2BYJ8_9PSED|nr:hypothetical protein [Pseudomonas arcuscaelestis]MBM5458679.1 hypothetical protein [Pseudomonas arcuscaelestis]